MVGGHFGVQCHERKNVEVCKDKFISNQTFLIFKLRRGLLSITAFMNFSKKSAGDKGMEGAYMLGWVYEIVS